MSASALQYLGAYISIRLSLGRPAAELAATHAGPVAAAAAAAAAISRNAAITVNDIQ